MSSLVFLEIDRISSATVRDEGDAQLVSLHHRLHQLWANEKINRELLVNAHVFVLEEMQRRGMHHQISDELDQKTERLGGPGKFGAYAPVLGSGAEMGREIATADVVAHLLPIKLQESVVNLISDEGGPALLLRPIEDEALHRIVPFRLFRLFPPELRDRIHFVQDAAGPFTPFIRVYDLSLSLSDRFPAEVQMSEGRLSFLSGLRSVKLQENVVALTGGVVNRGRTKNDVDLILRLPSAEALWDRMVFALYRLAPPETRDELRLFWDRWGPAQAFTPLFDLELALSKDFPQIVQMQEAPPSSALDTVPQPKRVLVLGPGGRVQHESNSLVLGDRRARLFALRDTEREIYRVVQVQAAYRRRAGVPTRPVLEFSHGREDRVLSKLAPGERFPWRGLELEWDGNRVPGLSEREEMLRLAIEALFVARAAAAEDPRLPRELVGYVDLEGNPDREHERCYICLFVQRPALGRFGGCTKIQGAIDIHGWCRLFLHQGGESKGLDAAEELVERELKRLGGAKKESREPKTDGDVRQAEERVALGRFIEGAKPDLGAGPNEPITLAGFLKHATRLPYLVSKKYDGLRVQLHADREDRSVSAFTEQGQRITDRLPELWMRVLDLDFQDSLVLEGELERWVEGKHQDREVTSGLINEKGKIESSGFVLNVFDVLLLDGEPVHRLPAEERHRLLHGLDFPQATEGKPEDGLNLTPQRLARTMGELERLARDLTLKPASEGVVAKPAREPYPFGPTSGWTKFRKTIVVRAMVLERVPTADRDAWNYVYGVAADDPRLNQGEIETLDGHRLLRMGKSFSTDVSLKAGELISIEQHNVKRNRLIDGSWTLTGFLPRVVVEPGTGKPLDGARAVLERAEKAGILVEKGA